MFHDVRTLSSHGETDPGFEIVALLEIHVDDVVATDHAVKRNGVAVHVDSLERRNLTGQRHDVARDVLEILQLSSQKF